MNISQWIIENIITAFGGVSVVVVALSAWLGKVLSGRILMREKAALEKQTQESLKRIEAELQLELLKKDRFHQISKPTFEAIFNRKIELYTDLLTACIGVRKYIDEGDYSGSEDWGFDLYGFQKEIKDKIEPNRMYVSEDLFNAFLAWYEEALPHLKEINRIGHVRFHPESSGVFDDVDVIVNQRPAVESFVTSTYDSFLKVVVQIERDIDFLRKSIDLPLQNMEKT